MSRPKCILQSMIFSDECCESEKLYVRSSGNVLRNGPVLQLLEGAWITTDTYMNAFDLGVWRKFTNISQISLQLEISGKCTIILILISEGEEKTLSKRDNDTTEKQCIELFLPKEAEKGIVYLRIEAVGETTLHSAKFAAAENNDNEKIKLGLAVCTYHRPEYIDKNLEKLRASRFFQDGDELQGKMQVHIVDNASELPVIREPQIELFHNPNTGGSGGFTRGIREFRKRQDSYQLTHMIFMDDDVSFIPETFYRLYAFLSYMKTEFADQVIAGRMFRTDNRQIQYTAAEIWNGGDLRHIGLNCDMTDRSVLENMNDSTGAEYGGWWFCCFPMPFVMNNDPLPFFLHCDDVEYGLRHGGTPLILNGIQVWHDTYEYRQSPVIQYYDTRNPLIVNAMYLDEQDGNEVYRRWFEAITKAHIQKDYKLEYMMIKGMRDFLKGEGYLRSDIQKKCNANINRKKNFSRYENMFFWRMTAFAFSSRFSKVTSAYRKIHL